MNEDLSDLRYLYKYGEYVSDCEIEMAKHLNSLSQDEIDKQKIQGDIEYLAMMTDVDLEEV